MVILPDAKNIKPLLTRETMSACMNFWTARNFKVEMSFFPYHRGFKCTIESVDGNEDFDMWTIHGSGEHDTDSYLAYEYAEKMLLERIRDYKATHPTAERNPRDFMELV